ncbi:MAG TPA: TrbI/VirB10 family protein [Bryobacteraceae bacterium]|nr:TrbI/VirB10 family protein [Bryobacteraceae bacterium]
MKLLAFIKSPAGNLVVFACFVAVGGLLIYRSNAREQARATQMTKVDAADAHPLRESILRVGQAFKAPARATPVTADSTSGVAADAGDGSRPRVARDNRAGGSPSKPRVLPISLVAIAAVETGPALSKTYAPFGRLIPCETVITIESSKLDTPVIGLVTEDVWHNGELVIPAGAEVHGRASLDRARERVAVSGKWVVVWRDGSPLNGTELVLNGIALDRAKDDVTGEFGLRDGSAGLLGDLVKTDDLQEIKLFASTFLAGFAGGLQPLQNQGTILGGIAQVPIASGRNAALQGTADVLNAYARQIQEAIARDGFFVRVPAGKQFYLYVTETVDVAKGTRGNVANAEIWRKQNEK